jgi:hypothetical protein
MADPGAQETLPEPPPAAEDALAAEDAPAAEDSPTTAEEDALAAAEDAPVADEEAVEDAPEVAVPLPAKEDELFERPPSRVPNAPSPSFADPLAVVPTGAATAELGNSLFDRYASSEPVGTQRFGSRNTATLTSRLRSTGIKLGCYLNTEANRGRAHTIHLPETCDTMGEVFALVQRRMGLDQRMLYAAELFVPDGTKVTSYAQLIDAAGLDTPIIVGCGEPFDRSTVPQAMLSFHQNGGGRAAAKAVKKELGDKRMRSAQLKADQVRASGHGLNSAAAQSAKAAAAEANRQSAATMRHDYMNQLIARSTQQNELIRHVQANNARLRSERARRDTATKSVWSQDRLQDLAENRRREASVWRERQEADELTAAKRADYAKRVRMTSQTEGKAAKSGLAEQRKAAGLERRMSYISRSVEKAAQEQDLIRSHQMKKQERKNSLLGLRSPLSSQAGSVYSVM